MNFVAACFQKLFKKKRTTNDYLPLTLVPATKKKKKKRQTNKKLQQ